MKLQLDIPPFDCPVRIAHTDNLFLMGSCFSDTMSKYFLQRKYAVLQNPFGVLYNPVSLANSLEQIASKTSYDTKEFYVQNGMAASWHHHSQFAHPDAHILKQKLDTNNVSAHTFLQKINIAFITLGTAHVYIHKEKQALVANNLQAPASFFDRKLLSIAEIEEALMRCVTSLQKLQPNVKIFFTLSPVRHTRLGLAQNNLGKAHLLAGIHSVCGRANNCFYFPSYELVMDVLRDYRFFEKDLVHPNGLATDFVWNYISEILLDAKDTALVDTLYKIYLASQHKIMHPATAASRQFIKQQIEIIEIVLAQNTYLDFSSELAWYKSL